MQCSVTVGRGSMGRNKTKTLNGYKNPYGKESNLDNIVDRLCTKLQDTKDQENEPRIGMPTCTLEHTEAVRKYYAAFPALREPESPLPYFQPPPVWCRKSAPDDNIKMQCDLTGSKDWNNRNRKLSFGKERRNSYSGQRKNRKRSSYSRSFESKENLPEWVTNEGAWDMESHDPVKEFIRAIALDEGYGTCENTVTDELKEITQTKMALHENMVPDWDDNLDLETEWVIKEDLNAKIRTPMEEELYAKFEAKFDRSIEALWSKDQNTPDDEYQDLPIDFQDLLSSPSDHLFADPSTEKCSLISLTESIWSNDGYQPADRVESPSKIVEVLHDRFKPLNLTDTTEEIAPRDVESFTLYDSEEIYDAVSTVAETMRSFTAINHSRDRSGFVEVLPRRNKVEKITFGSVIENKPVVDRRTPSAQREDLLSSSKTHFRPIRHEIENEPTTRYADGDTFDICSDLDTVEFRRSDSGGVYLEGSFERYLEYRGTKSIDYGRLNLTEAQKCPDLEDPGFRLRFPLRQLDAAVQTEELDEPEVVWDACEECGRSAKKMRSSVITSIWSSGGCQSCAVQEAGERATVAAANDELSQEWEELLADISAAHAEYLRVDPVVDETSGVDRKRRHSAARCAAPCTHPHARFLHCCALALDRPLTR